jgi:FAD binding domain
MTREMEHKPQHFTSPTFHFLKNICRFRSGKWFSVHLDLAGLLKLSLSARSLQYLKMFLSMHALGGILVLLSGIVISNVHGKIITYRDDNCNCTAGNDLTNCLVSKEVPFQIPSDVQFPGLNEPFNLRLNYTPVAIALPSTPEQVSNAVTCASAAHVPVQARSGGHSYASYSSGGQNGSLVINLELFQDISVDPNTMIASVGGGVRLGNLALGLYEYGGLRRAVPHGTCPGYVYSLLSLHKR